MIEAILNVFSKSLAFGDTGSVANPKLRHFDWSRSVESIPVNNPRNTPYFLLPGEERTVFDGSRTLTLDGSTELDLSLNPNDNTRYRLSWNGHGTAPGFRTDRGLTLAGLDATVVVNPNSTITLSISVGPSSFSLVQAGDVIFIPGPTTGDIATVLSASNEGWWNVLTASTTSLVLSRPTGDSFQAEAQTATLTSDIQVNAFSSSGVQNNDTLDITAGFATSSRKTYSIVAVTAAWIEFVSTSPIAIETGITPGITGVAVYSSASKWIRIESDQECAIRLNGDTSSYVRVSPCVGGTVSVGWFEKFGTVYSLKVANLSASTASVMILSAD